MEEKYYTMKEIADRYGVSRALIGKLIRSGELRAERIATVWRIPESAWKEYLERNREKK